VISTDPKMRADSPRGRRAAFAACLLAAAAISACGSARKASPPPARQQVTATLRAYLRAQAAGNGHAACARLTASAQRQLIEAVAKAGKGLIPTGLSCTEAVALASAVAGSTLTSLAHARVDHVQVQGSRATADVTASGFPREHVMLVRVGGTWKIARVAGLAG
jgi:hypothetical protein